MSRKYRGLTRKQSIDGKFIWHIDKEIRGYGRLCESTGESDEEEAGAYLNKRIKEIQDAIRYGVRPKRKFRTAAARFLNENAHKRGITKDAESLSYLLPFIGEMFIEDHGGKRDRLYSMLQSSWRSARRRAATRYKEIKNVEAPAGFQKLRVHDLRHTFGRRLRAAEVSLEDREDLLGHKSGRITTHYSAAEIGNLVTSANQATKSRKSPARTMLRLVA